MKSLNDKILLDFEYRETDITKNIDDILDSAHTEIENNFELSITDKLRELFYKEDTNV